VARSCHSAPTVFRASPSHGLACTLSPLSKSRSRSIARDQPGSLAREMRERALPHLRRGSAQSATGRRSAVGSLSTISPTPAPIGNARSLAPARAGSLAQRLSRQLNGRPLPGRNRDACRCPSLRSRARAMRQGRQAPLSTFALIAAQTTRPTPLLRYHPRKPNNPDP
jgi:hypothetical protein